MTGKNLGEEARELARAIRAIGDKKDDEDDGGSHDREVLKPLPKDQSGGATLVIEETG